MENNASEGKRDPLSLQWKLTCAEVDCIFMGELQELQLSANHLGSALLQRNM